jgi:hypothetical protein
VSTAPPDIPLETAAKEANEAAEIARLVVSNISASCLSPAR